MKELALVTFTLVSMISCFSNRANAQSNLKYQVISDSETKVLKGYINRSILESDTSFKWFAENMKYGTADAAAVAAFKTNASQFNIVIFGGTWCHDTQNLLPVFYRLVDKSGYPENKITLIAVDRSKTAPNDLEKVYKVTNVPTFIVMKDGKELGRVVEYGNEGQIDKELGEIVSNQSTGTK
jgi:thiol-disulfide isomerase/thioredoxin